MEASKRLLRRKINKPKKAGAGRGFFVAALFILIFAIVYNFTDILPSRHSFSPALDEIFVSFIDVGQGDSILIRSADNAVLIDGGQHRYRNVVLSYLQEANVSRLDIVVATHPHSDHIGSLPTIISRIDVGFVAMPEITHNTETFENFLEAILNNDIDVVFPLAGDILQAGIINLEVVSPQNISNNINNSSIVLRLVHGETAFLFTGDAEREAEMQMVSSGQDIRANVLKIGHHGSRTSTTQSFLNQVAPDIAVISVGGSNPFGHPHNEVVARLKEAEVDIFRTDIHGNILMATNGRGIFVHVGG